MTHPLLPVTIGARFAAVPHITQHSLQEKTLLYHFGKIKVSTEMENYYHHLSREMTETQFERTQSFSPENQQTFLHLFVFGCFIFISLGMQ